MLSVVVISVTMDWLTWDMKIEQPRLLLPRGWQKTEYFGKGGRTAVGCQCLPWGTMAMGTQQTLHQISVPTNVPPCHCNQPEWTIPCYLPGPERTITWMRPGGGTYHHGACLSWLHLRRHRRPVLGCEPTLEVTWKKLMWGGYQGVPMSRDPWLHQGMPLVQAAICTARGEYGQLQANVPQPDPHTEFAAANCSTC